MEIKSFCSDGLILYRERMCENGPIHKVYEVSLPSSGAGRIIGIPDGTVDLQILLSDDASMLCDLVGSYTRAGHSRLNAYTRCIGVKFNPGLEYSMLGLPASRLIDNRMDASALMDREAAEYLVRAENDFDDLALRLEELIISHRSIAKMSETNYITAFILNIINARKGIVRIEEIIDRLGCSHRHAAAVFKETMGCTIKSYADIVRMQHAIGMLTGEQISYSSAIDSAELGYYDQSHFIRSFKKYTTLTPEVYRSQRGSLQFL